MYGVTRTLFNSKISSWDIARLPGMPSEPNFSQTKDSVIPGRGPKGLRFASAPRNDDENL